MFEAVFFTVFTGFEDGGALAGNALSTTSPTTKSAVVF